MYAMHSTCTLRYVNIPGTKVTQSSLTTTASLPFRPNSQTARRHVVCFELLLGYKWGMEIGRLWATFCQCLVPRLQKNLATLDSTLNTLLDLLHCIISTIHGCINKYILSYLILDDLEMSLTHLGRCLSQYARMSSFKPLTDLTNGCTRLLLQFTVLQPKQKKHFIWCRWFGNINDISSDKIPLQKFV